MSATNRRRKKIANDDYPTPREVIENIATNLWLRIPPSHLILDPFAGEGAILQVFKQRGHPVVGVEIQPKYEDALAALCDEHIIGDCFEVLGDSNNSLNGSTIVTNPPFSLAERAVRRFATKCDRMVMLSRQGFLSSGKRRDLYMRFRPRAIYQMIDRPTFVWVCKSDAKDSEGFLCTAAPYPVGTTKPCTECGSTVGPGTDASDYVWIEWGRESAAMTDFHWLPPCRESEAEA